MLNFFWFECAVTEHAIAIARHEPFQGVAYNAKCLKSVEDVVGLIGERDGGIEVVNVESATIDLESDGIPPVSHLVEIAVVFDPENQFFD